MKRLLLVSLISTLVVISVLPVFAELEDSLQVHVTSTLVAVSLAPDAIDFGTLSAGEEAVSVGTPVVTNEGSVPIVVDMKGTDAAYGEHTWNLSSEGNGANQFMLMISKDNTWESGVLNLNTDYQDFYHDPSLASKSGQGFKVKILMPNPISTPGEYTANIYVRATQSGG